MSEYSERITDLIGDVDSLIEDMPPSYEKTVEILYEASHDLNRAYRKLWAEGDD